ncbi:MAG TPA: hypothetical protein VFZ59_06085 [Verrucomicrobiae bacterium]|nr:hypothetical protein [Verrucomicrobiae bacterium]
MKTLFVLGVLFGAALFGKGAEVPSRSGSSVWYWQARDRSQRMKLEVLLDNKRIFATTFSIAQSGREQISKTSHAERIEFSFRPKRSIVWEGYRDEAIRSAARQRIRCDIWMAGADETAIILGVSFVKSDAILMNTLHLALPTTAARSEIADGLVVVTSPVSETKPDRTQQRTGSPRWARER